MKILRSSRQLKGLKKWLIELGMTQQEIADACGVSRPLVAHTISGRRRNRKVIDFFLSRGCPRELVE
ncbi:MAG: helix-turn-helix transcriptional regulator [Syntrophobacteraceae bacterium]